MQREMHRLREDQRHRGSLKKTLKGLREHGGGAGPGHLQGHRGDDVEDGHACHCVEINQWVRLPSSRRRNGNIVASMAWGLHAIEQTQLRKHHRVDGVGRPMRPHARRRAGMAGLDMANLPSAAADQPQMSEAQMRRHARHRAGVKPPASARRRGRGGGDGRRLICDELLFFHRLRLLRRGVPRAPHTSNRLSKVNLASVLLR